VNSFMVCLMQKLFSLNYLITFEKDEELPITLEVFYKALLCKEESQHLLWITAPDPGRKTYDNTISMMVEAVRRSHISPYEKDRAIRTSHKYQLIEHFP